MELRYTNNNNASSLTLALGFYPTNDFIRKMYGCVYIYIVVVVLGSKKMICMNKGLADVL